MDSYNGKSAGLVGKKTACGSKNDGWVVDGGTVSEWFSGVQRFGKTAVVCVVTHWQIKSKYIHICKKKNEEEWEVLCVYEILCITQDDYANDFKNIYMQLSNKSKTVSPMQMYATT